MGLFFALILLMVMAFVVIGVISAVAWLLWAGLVALAVAALAGLVFSAALTGTPDPWSTTALVSGAAFFVLAIAIGSRKRRQQRLERQDFRSRLRTMVPPPRVPASQPTPPPVPPPVAMPNEAEDGDPKLAAAWNRLADKADFARSRINVARTSCARFLALAERHQGNGMATELALLINKHVPEHVDECLAACRTATGLEARGLLEEAVVDLERLGARADKRRSALIEAAGPGQRRSLLARRLDNDDPFG
jgi:hypothetical protein